MKITQSRNEREGKFIGYSCKGWKGDASGRVMRYTYHYRGYTGDAFRASDLVDKLFGPGK